MNVQHPSVPYPEPVQDRPVRHRRPQLKPRERDFGIGYGKSSGYASNRRYASDWVQPLFRCA